MLQEGLEPPTLGLLDSCSTKLSYQSSAGPHSGSNLDLHIVNQMHNQLSYMVTYSADH